MVTVGSNREKIAYGIKHFILDTNADFAQLRKHTNIAVGSTAFVIDTSKYYMLNSKNQWKEVRLYGSSSSNNGGDSGDTDSGVDYDGGSIDGTDPYTLF